MQPLTDFTPPAQAVLSLALHEATTLGAAELEPEHLLLGMLSPNTGTVWALLSAFLGGDPRILRSAVEETLDGPSRQRIPGPPPLSFRAERALREAAGEAARARHGLVDSSHLLLGLLNEGGNASALLRQRGLDAGRLRQWIREQEGPGIEMEPAEVAEPIEEAPPPPADVIWKALPRLIDWRAVGLMLIALVGGGWMATQPELETFGIVLLVLSGWLVSLCTHEFAHALVADLGGDHSVRHRGYLSFNPLAYTHVGLSIVLPILFLLMGGIGLPGGAVYINEGRLRGPIWRSLVSAAGPISSLMVTLLMALPFMVFDVNLAVIREAPGFWGALALLVLLNLSAVVLNSLPMPPLDGFGVLAPWLPIPLQRRLYAFGQFGVMLLFFAFWVFEPLSSLFWGSIIGAIQGMGIDPRLVAYGLEKFRFWQ